jgi:uncharacterized protein YggE
MPIKLHTAFLLSVLALTTAAQAEEEIPKITEIGEGTICAKPDEFYISGGAVTWNTNVTRALAENTFIMVKVKATLAKKGVDPDHIRTIEFQVVSDHLNGKSQEKDGYIVTNKIKVILRDFSKIGEIVDSMVADGVNKIDSIRVGYSKIAELTDTARENGVVSAQRRATLIANKLGYDLDGVVVVKEIYDYNHDYSPGKSVCSYEYKVKVEVTWYMRKKPAILSNTKE